MLVLCCGNRDRGDDAAGLAVAERLLELGLPVETCTGEASELMEKWGKASDVLVIDAIVTGAPAGKIYFWDVKDVEFARNLFPSTHGLGLSEAIGIARSLGGLPARLRICGIEARQFETGKALSPDVRKGVEELVRMLAVARE